MPLVATCRVRAAPGNEGTSARAGHEPVLSRLVELGAPGLVLSGNRGEGLLRHGVGARVLPTGRAVRARSGRPPELVQLAWTPEVEPVV